LNAYLSHIFRFHVAAYTFDSEEKVIVKRRQFIESVVASAFAVGTRPLLAGSVLGRNPPSSPGILHQPGQTNTGGPEREFFYRPNDAWAADFIPYYSGDKFHLFFLLDWRDKAARGEGTPWYQVTTQDFVHFDELGQMLPRGAKEEQDLYVFTGSVVHGEGKHHIFYTGHNPYFPARGKPEQGVMHAVSSDLLHWDKVPEDTFYAPSSQYEANDWRDPFVFWNAEANEYWMLLAARLKAGPSRRRGCTALCSSKDLKTWKVHDPFWAPGLFYTHECPDLFRMGEWWYLVFSEFTDLTRTRYRMSRSLEGPWIAPESDYFDGRAFYAAKTASDGKRRFLFGWDPTRADKRDYHRWDWGGNLVVHELHQQKDGLLTVDVPSTIDRAWSQPVDANFTLQKGARFNGNDVTINAAGSFGWAAAGTMPERCRIETQIQFEADTRRCGIMMRTSDDMESSYYVRLEPQNHRIVFDSWPRGAGSDHPITSTDGGYMTGLDRWVTLESETPIDLKIFVDRTIAVIYVDGRIAMSIRMYDLPVGRWGLFVEQGSAQFKNVKITTL
jgi:beta-fructofuranosidase